MSDFIVADVFDGLATLEDGSIDLVVTSPPFLALRSYLPADHPDKDKEIGSEPTPAEWIDTMLRVTAELRRVLAPHGSIAVELGDTYANPAPGGNAYGSGPSSMSHKIAGQQWNPGEALPGSKLGRGWPLAKSKTLIPELYRLALAYGFNPLTGTESPAGQWRVRNVVTWCRPNPPVGALGDKWRPATSDVVVACVSGKRYWDDLATRKPFAQGTLDSDGASRDTEKFNNATNDNGRYGSLRTNRITHSGAPLLDYWEIPPGGYKGSHYAVFPQELVVPLVKAMCPEKVCRTCGEPSRRVFAHNGNSTDYGSRDIDKRLSGGPPNGVDGKKIVPTGDWSDCGHDDYRPGRVLDPFAGSGTTLAVAHGHGHDTVGIDLDERNADLARDRVGPMFLNVIR